MIFPIILLTLLVLTAWIVHVAGWRFAVQRLAGAIVIVVIVTFATTALLRMSAIDEQGKQALAELDGNFIIPICSKSGTATANFRFVYNVVVDERCQMHHFDDDRHSDMVVVDFARSRPAEANEERTQLLSISAQRVFGIRQDLGFKFPGLGKQTFGDRF